MRALDCAALAPASLALDQLGQISGVRDLLLSGCGRKILAVGLYASDVVAAGMAAR